MFHADGQLKKIALSGGSAVTLCESTRPEGLSWGVDTVFVGARGSIRRVSADGGPLEEVLAGDANQVFTSPHLLPDGRTLLFSRAPLGGPRCWSTRLIRGESSVLLEGSTARYVVPGYLVYSRPVDTASWAIVAAPFDRSLLEVSGEPKALVEGLADNTQLPSPLLGCSRTCRR